MKSLTEFINEQRLTKAEQDLLNKFTKDGEVITVTKTADNSNIRGGTGISGTKEFTAASSLVNKGLVTVVDKDKDSGATHLKIQLVGSANTSLSDFERAMYDKVKAFETEGKYSDPRDKSSFMKTNKKEQTAMQRLAKLGYIKFSTISPSTLKSL